MRVSDEPIETGKRRGKPTLVAAVVLLAATLIAGACGLLSTRSSSSEREVPTFSPEITQVVEGTNRFGLELFQTLNLGNYTRDPAIQLISPVGISASLTMVLEGARGKTRHDIRRVLGVSDQPARAVLDAQTRVLTYLSNFDPDFFYESLQAVLVREGLRLTDSFVLLPERFPGAEIQQFDFGHPKARPILNEWIANLTRGRARDLIYQLSNQDLLAVMNAAYVIGPWRYRFDPSRTGPAAFRTRDGSTVELRFLRQDGIYPYMETDSMRMISLPYGDSLFAMRIVTPTGDRRLHRMIQELDLAQWHRWTEALEPAYLEVAIPSIPLWYRETLNNELSAAGLSELFSPADAELGGIGPGSIGISRFRHQSNLGPLQARGLRPPVRPESDAEPLGFPVNRPFLIVVSERATGALLFIGRISDEPPEEPRPDRGPVPSPDDL